MCLKSGRVQESGHGENRPGGRRAFSARKQAQAHTQPTRKSRNRARTCPAQRAKAARNTMHVRNARACFRQTPSFIRTVTVGFGITPNLLTPRFLRSTGARGACARTSGIAVRARHYRRWGIAPRPENVCPWPPHCICICICIRVTSASAQRQAAATGSPIISSGPSAALLGLLHCASPDEAARGFQDAPSTIPETNPAWPAPLLPILLPRSRTLSMIM